MCACACAQSAAELCALSSRRLQLQEDALHAHFETTVAAQLALQAVRAPMLACSLHSIAMHTC
jgi:hypothetical protein